MIRVTTEADGQFVNRMYSYWSSSVILNDSIYVFAGHVDGHPRFFKVGFDGNVERLGSLVRYTGEAEGWYWDASGWIYLCDGPILKRVNPFTGGEAVVFDVLAAYPGCDLWQAHSSDDGTVHCATVRRIVSDGAYPKVATVLATPGRLRFFPTLHDLDESQVTPDGSYLIIKEGDENRIITVETDDERVIADADGAVGHSDCGPRMVVGEDNIAGVCRRWDLDALNSRALFSTWNLGHLSIRAGKCLRSDEHILSLVDLETGAQSPLVAHGMVGEGYDYQVFANLDPSGRVACFVSNMVGSRFDVYLYVLP